MLCLFLVLLFSIPLQLLADSAERDRVDSANFTFRQVEENDIPLLYKWFHEPHVSKWWPVPRESEYFEQFLARIRSKGTTPYVGLYKGRPLGYVQCYPIGQKDRDWLPPLPEGTIGTDQFIGEPDCIGKGYGTAFLREFARFYAKQEPGISTIIVDPDPTNEAAVRCYEKVGFKSRGVVNAPWGPAHIMQYDLKRD